MENILVPVVLLATTLAAYWIGRGFARASHTTLWGAFRQMFECVGAGVLFFAVNVALGITLALVVRTVGSRFVSLYAMDDITLVILSMLQGLVFRFWWRSAKEMVQ